MPDNGEYYKKEVQELRKQLKQQAIDRDNWEGAARKLALENAELERRLTSARERIRRLEGVAVIEATA